MPLECKQCRPVDILYMRATAEQILTWQGPGIKNGARNLQLGTMPIIGSLY